MEHIILAELDQKTHTSAADANGAALMASPNGVPHARDIAFESLQSEGAQDHDTGLTIAPTLPHSGDSQVVSSPTFVVVDTTIKADVAEVIQVAEIETVQSAINVAGASVPPVDLAGRVSEPAIASAHPESTSEPHIDPVADWHANPAGQAVAHQFELLIAEGVADETEGVSATVTVPHQTIVNDGGMVLNLGGLDLGIMYATTGASIGGDPAAIRDENSPADITTVDAVHSFSMFRPDVLMQDLAANWNAPDHIVANEQGQKNHDAPEDDSTSLPSLTSNNGNGDTSTPNFTTIDATTHIDHGASGERSVGPIISSGAAFWTVGVDGLDGSSLSSMPAYTAGNDLSVGSLTAAHLDQVQTLSAVLGGH